MRKLLLSVVLMSAAAFIAVGARPSEAQEAGQGFRDCEVCPEMVVVPAGSFMMGSLDPQNDDAKPRHRVAIRYTFAVGVYEVTRDEWDACVRNGGCDGREAESDGFDRGRHPVVNVSWGDAWRYADWLSGHTGERYRLLSEAEWEYAARAGTTTPYYFGGRVGAYVTPRSICEYAHVNESTQVCNRRLDDPLPGITAPVGSYLPNAFGLYDVVGNVMEWVDDCWHEDYRGAPRDGRAWDGRAWGEDACEQQRRAIFVYTMSPRVLRGGSRLGWPRLLVSAGRFSRSSQAREDDVGFRVARTVN